jgi:phage tail-like protein
MPALDSRSFVSRYFALTLDGQNAGMCRSVDGGGIKGDLIAQQIGGQPHRIKHINNPIIEPISVQVGMTMSKDFYQWIDASWKGRAERRNGSITVYDSNYKPQFEYSFSDALILETTLPPMDGASKEPAYMTVKFQAERAENKFAPGGGRPSNVENTLQKQLMPANFRLEIEGLDVSRVSKIDPITVKQNVKPMSCGPDWMYQLEPTSLEFPNLTVYLAMASAKGFYDWHQEFVIGGKNGPDNERTGAITFISPNLQEDLLTINLDRVGILNIVSEKADAGGGDQVKRVKVEMYVEEMSFDYGDEMR